MAKPNGRIYKITNKIDNQIYVGYTNLTLKEVMEWCERNMDEKADRKNDKLHKLMQQYGFDKFRIKLIEKFPCKSQHELAARCGYWQEQFNPSLNLIINGKYKEKIKRPTRRAENDFSDSD